MNCPLIQPKIEYRGGEEMVRMGKCTEEECAWWEPKIGKCSILRIWIALQDIHEVLHDIENKMPHEGQIRK